MSARDRYLLNTTGVGMHVDMVHKYVENQVLAVAVILPHWSEHLWLEVLHKPSTIQNALWPKLPTPDHSLSKANEYVFSTTSNITSAEGVQHKRQQKGKGVSFDPSANKKLTVYCTTQYPSWQEKYIELVRQSFEKTSVVDMRDISQHIAKADSKKAMPFIQGLKKSLDSNVEPKVVFDRKLAFDEVEVLTAMAPGLKSTVPKCVAVEIVRVDEDGKGEVVCGVGELSGAVGDKRDELLASQGPVPGTPSFYFINV